ncbi:type-F conjugative transfer system mating-pair stabilization protein TraN [Gibbsiella quercinecans]|uniref:type-F conjugative transfer system mating-pair stabilization protein TraN n=1 Tax=Gibbsiella quercinecans TaxID=929813 RepID=UPI000EF278B1|nr:type-F conjugative transfer system mating-pair stabilization protein TraN [Gibbsiella quercinecans]RLM11810.1 type-F conjugative transfer system mating-pair stabilization protein TraN [Gibbsiella quercinecans]
MKFLPVILTLHASVLSTFIWFALPACADSETDYKAGSDFAKQVQGSGLDSLKNFSGEQNLPGYTDSPEQTRYYGGVTASGDSSLKGDSASEFSQSDTGKTITESFTNRPPDSISADTPFIQAAKDTESRANSIVGNTGEACTAQIVNRSEFSSHTCERDLQIEQSCIRTASITGHYEDTSEIKQMTIQSNNINFSPSKSGYTGSLSVPVTGRVVSASAAYSWNKGLAFSNSNWFMQVTTPFGLISMDDDAGSLVLSSGVQLTKGSNMLFSIRNRNNRSDIDSMWKSSNMSYSFTISLQIDVPAKKWVPDVVWNESCPFSKDEGKQTTTECIEPGGNKTINQDGNVHDIYQSCWKYRDTYITQPSDYGSCQTLMDNHSCTLASRQCAFAAEDGTCLHEYATYSCETRTSGKQMICGGDVFCLDGECDKAASGKNSDFGQAVSELAALAAAGKDVAALNGVNVRAFTGNAKYCKKFAAGFSNCCTDSGWGQDVGLAHCSSEEKALAKAKANKLTISIGEFCSKKVLGVCLEKKRSYCQFDSKLAQIVQQQGRNGQLHIGFGEAKGPDCRGISVEELKQINFNQLDFTNFMEDLINNQNIPKNAELTEKTKVRIKELLTKSSAK